MTQTPTAGDQAEYLALLYLQRQGLKLLNKNWRCPLGEIDLIMQQADTLVFIEVRYRKTALWGSAEESVTTSKQKRITNTAYSFLQQNPRLIKMKCRFDVIALSGNISSSNIKWLTNAFNLSH